MQRSGMIICENGKSGSLCVEHARFTRLMSTHDETGLCLSLEDIVRAYVVLCNKFKLTESFSR